MATTVKVEIVKDSDNTVLLKCLIDNVTGATITTATVTARVLDLNDAELAGVTWPVAMSHVGNGDYRGVIPNDMVIAAEQKVIVEVRADDGADRFREFRETTTVKG